MLPFCVFPCLSVSFRVFPCLSVSLCRFRNEPGIVSYIEVITFVIFVDVARPGRLWPSRMVARRGWRGSILSGYGYVMAMLWVAWCSSGYPEYLTDPVPVPGYLWWNLDFSEVRVAAGRVPQNSSCREHR